MQTKPTCVRSERIKSSLAVFLPDTAPGLRAGLVFGGNESEAVRLWRELQRCLYQIPGAKTLSVLPENTLLISFTPGVLQIETDQALAAAESEVARILRDWGYLLADLPPEGLH